MDGEVVLGDLPEGWTVKASYEEDGQLRPTYHHTTNGTRTTEDPRFEDWPMPPEWEPVEWERTRDDPMCCVRYSNKRSGLQINYDPRLEPEALQARNVPCEWIKLI
jgi:hypothetical protein